MKINEKQAAQLEYVRDLPDDRIDTSDAPEVLDWSNAKRGLLYEPVKQDINLQLDEYVIDWFKERYQESAERDEAINKALMDHIRAQMFPKRKHSQEHVPQEAGN